MTETELQRLFRTLRTKFARLSPSVASVTLEISDASCSPAPTCAWRDLAWASFSGTRMRVHVLRRVLTLPRDNLIAVLAHELGHAADAARDLPWREQRADDIAEDATGMRIRYDRLNLQTVGRGRYPRPLELHR